jgi:hypothetical protein
MKELKEKLQTEVEQADWDMLRVHHEKGSVFFIHGHLELLDVAVAVAKDKAEFIKVWLDSNELARPSEIEIEEYEKEPYRKICDFIIIQPYVLAKPFEKPSDLN